MEKFNAGKTKYLKYVNWVLEKFIHENHRKEQIDWNGAKEILIIDYNAIGDVVMLTPFLNSVRENAPSAKITLVCRYLAEDVLSNQGLVDTFITSDRRWFSTRHHVLRDIFEALITIHKCRRTNFDIALEPRGDLRDIYLMHFVKANRKAGYTHTGGAYMMTDPVDTDSNITHMIDEKMYFLKMLGCVVDESKFIPKLQLSKWQIVDNEKFLAAEGLKNQMIIGVHPAASIDLKEWNSFGALIHKIHNKMPKAKFVIFMDDNKDDLYKDLLHELEDIRESCICVKEDIKTYIQRVAICNIMICNDSGAGHIAAAFGIDVHVIFGPVLPELAKPYSEANVFTYENKDVQCRPCNIRGCAHQKECLKSVSVDEVFEGIIYSLNLRKEE
ncbi:ADP-heptose:LPS heptosyltransferase [Pseudobutyrivibrio ruminis]|uniref:ADP-heptose:LPS heptosyltransferase n=1 Tax=Pseudobutyrivibrio ruminis TaxID=46206 RepID=A0A1H7FD72_9FIRM|nr:glycosyltransferase family 9 protein [Pseudobutyrivibrio ruminis]SEK22010.1 ADP-heptose:LPS heptosyltransferase [Pseudobutyrivibrio ruminis]